MPLIYRTKTFGSTMATKTSNNHNQSGKAPHNYHPENIEGKAVIVTGGTTGIGFATAKLLVERGARVLIFGRDKEELKNALNELNSLGEAHALSADQSKPNDVQRIFARADEKLGGVDILVNNAAVAAGSILKDSIEDISYGLNVNLLGYIACSREAVPRMKGRGGHIVCVGSLSAQQREEENDVYVATKAGIQAFCESLRKAVNPQGIKVSLIEPGLIATPLAEKSPAKRDAKVRKGEMLEAEDIAEAVHYVLTQPARCDVISVQIRPHNQSI
jgi:NADP-dependent 3-hydroxy acid dehydrogenase YdfG